MLKLLLVGDPHFKKTNLDDMDILSFDVIKYIEEYKPDAVVIMGDLLHTHESINSIVLCKCIEFLKQIALNVKLYVIIGNHDRINNSDFMSDIHPFTAVDMWENAKVISKTEKVTLVVRDKEYKILMVPYVYPGRFAEAINTVDNPLDVTCVLCHQEFFGCKMGGIISAVGDKWNSNNPLVISGHIHDYQRLGGNIIYVGSPIQHSFGSSNCGKISLFEFSDKVKETRLDINVKKRKTIYVDCVGMKSLKNITNSKYHIRIVIKDTKANIDSMMRTTKLPNVKITVKVVDEVFLSANGGNFEEILIKEMGDNLPEISWYNYLSKGN